MHMHGKVAASQCGQGFFQTFLGSNGVGTLVNVEQFNPHEFIVHRSQVPLGPCERGKRLASASHLNRLNWLEFLLGLAPATAPSVAGGDVGRSPTCIGG